MSCHTKNNAGSKGQWRYFPICVVIFLLSSALESSFKPFCSFLQKGKKVQLIKIELLETLLLPHFTTSFISVQVPKCHQANKISHFLMRQSLAFSALSRIWDFDKRFKLEVRGQSFPKSQAFSFVLARLCCPARMSGNSVSWTIWLQFQAWQSFCRQAQSTPNHCYVSFDPSRALFTHQFLLSNSVWSQVSNTNVPCLSSWACPDAGLTIPGSANICFWNLAKKSNNSLPSFLLPSSSLLMPSLGFSLSRDHTSKEMSFLGIR